MNKKIYKRVGLLSISALAALSLSVPVKAEQSCKRYSNYYFFSETKAALTGLYTFKGKNSRYYNKTVYFDKNGVQ